MNVRPPAIPSAAASRLYPDRTPRRDLDHRDAGRAHSARPCRTPAPQPAAPSVRTTCETWTGCAGLRDRPQGTSGSPADSGFNINYNTVASQLLELHLGLCICSRTWNSKLSSTDCRFGFEQRACRCQFNRYFGTDRAIEAYICPDDQKRWKRFTVVRRQCRLHRNRTCADSGSQDHRISAYDFRLQRIAN